MTRLADVRGLCRHVVVAAMIGVPATIGGLALVASPAVASTTTQQQIAGTNLPSGTPDVVDPVIDADNSACQDLAPGLYEPVADGITVTLCAPTDYGSMSSIVVPLPVGTYVVSTKDYPAPAPTPESCAEGIINATVFGPEIGGDAGSYIDAGEGAQTLTCE